MRDRREKVDRKGGKSDTAAALPLEKRKTT